MERWGRTTAVKGRQDLALPMVQAGLLGPAIDYAHSRGANVDALLKRSHLPVDIAYQPTHFVPAEGWFHLLADLTKEACRADVGWQISCAHPLKGYSRELTMGMFGAPTLLEAMRFVTRIQSRHSNCQRLWVRVFGDFGYVFHRDNCRCPGYEQRSAFRAASIVLAARAFIGEHWRPDLIITDTPLNVYPECDLLAGTRILRRPHYSAVRIPRADLMPTPRDAHRYEGSYSGGTGLDTDTLSCIRQLLSSYARHEIPTLAELAEMMRTSERSLQRHLRQLHTSYSRLVKEAVFSSARDLLNDPGRSITDIAHTLGYDDASHFSRFFRRMGGVNPTEYRNHLPGAAPAMPAVVH